MTRCYHDKKNELFKIPTPIRLSQSNLPRNLSIIKWQARCYHDKRTFFIPTPTIRLPQSNHVINHRRTKKFLSVTQEYINSRGKYYSWWLGREFFRWFVYSVVVQLWICTRTRSRTNFKPAWMIWPWQPK